jgi:hypothetical protein
LLSVILNLIAGLIFTLCFLVFIDLSVRYLDIEYLVFIEKFNLLIAYGWILVQVILHECSHAVGYKVYGGKVAFGIKWLCPYCREKTGKFYTVNQFILTLILPIIVVTLMGMVAIFLFPECYYYASICILANLAGASGDVMMLMYVLFFTKKNYYVRDELYGFSMHQAVLNPIGIKEY